MHPFWKQLYLCRSPLYTHTYTHTYIYVCVYIHTDIGLWKCTWLLRDPRHCLGRFLRTSFQVNYPVIRMIAIEFHRITLHLISALLNWKLNCNFNIYYQLTYLLTACLVSEPNSYSYNKFPVLCGIQQFLNWSPYWSTQNPYVILPIS
jgi:hypothetical protein